MHYKVWDHIIQPYPIFNRWSYGMKPWFLPSFLRGFRITYSAVWPFWMEQLFSWYHMSITDVRPDVVWIFLWVIWLIYTWLIPISYKGNVFNHVISYEIMQYMSSNIFATDTSKSHMSPNDRPLTHDCYHVHCTFRWNCGTKKKKHLLSEPI